MSVSMSSHNSDINDFNRCFVIINGYRTSIPKECCYCFWYSSKSRLPRCCHTRKNVKSNFSCDKFYNVYMVNPPSYIQEPKNKQTCLEF